MAEKVIPEALSGYEIKQALTHLILDALRRECYLRDDNSYLKFTGKIKLEVTLHDVGQAPEVKREIPFDFGNVPEGENPDEFLEKYEAEHEIQESDPNTVRVETEQPIPVLTSENGKPAVKRVKYAPQKKAKS